MKKGKWLSEEALKIAVRRREAKSKGEKERYIHSSSGTLSDLVPLQFIELFTFSFFSVTGRSIELDYHDIEWFALEMKRDHSVVFEFAYKRIPPYFSKN